MSKEVNWQEECLKKGFEYVREPDDHYVIAAPAEMVALLRDLIGVDVRTKSGVDYGASVSELLENIDGLVNTLHTQHDRIEALLAERDAYEKALKKLATVPGCGCSFPCRCGGEEWTRAELEGRMGYAAETLARAALQGEQP